MKRRDLITILSVAVAVQPGAALAQQTGGMRKVGVLYTGTKSASEDAGGAAFRRGLADLGWSEGQNVQFDLRYAGENLKLSGLAAELVSQAPDAILAVNAAAVAALLALTHAIPIVFVNVPDPVGQGLVSSLARPGGNVTGFTNFEYSMGSKWLQLLKEVAPRITRVVVAFTPRIQSYRRLLNVIDAAAKPVGIATVDTPLLTARDLRRLADLMDRPKTGLIALPNFFVSDHRAELIELTARAKVPAIYTYPEFTAAGGLMVYGVSENDMYRNAAAYVNRILRGASPQDLPVQNPTKYGLSVNLKTAKALGLTVPPSLLVQADDVIR